MRAHTNARRDYSGRGSALRMTRPERSAPFAENAKGVAPGSGNPGNSRSLARSQTRAGARAETHSLVMTANTALTFDRRRRGGPRERRRRHGGLRRTMRFEGLQSAPGSRRDHCRRLLWARLVAERRSVTFTSLL